MRTINLNTIGCISDSSSAARANTARLRYELGQAQGGLRVLVGGRYYLDLWDGPIEASVGIGSNLSDLWITGPGMLCGIGSPKPTTPMFVFRRRPGALPHIVVERLNLTSDGSVLHWVGGGVMARMQDVAIETFLGRGRIDYEGWSDLDTASYGVRLDNVDTFTMEDCSIFRGSGHGVIATRWHDGSFSGRIGHCEGSGFKMEQANGLVLRGRSESNWGYAYHLRDCGIDRRRQGQSNGGNGAPSTVDVWNESCNGRSPVTGMGHGYRFSQAKLENCARIHFSNHSGSIVNQIRADKVSRTLCTFGEPFPVPAAKPDYQLQHVVPPMGHNTNWAKLWEEDRYRPRWEGGTVTWPAGSLNHTTSSETAYWRMFPSLRSPGTYLYRVTVEDMTGAMVDYCERREAETPRQPAAVAGFAIAPVAGSINCFPMWDAGPLEITGAFTVEDPRPDITLQMMTFANGMDDPHDVAAQTRDHVMRLHSCDFWQIA